MSKLNNKYGKHGLKDKRVCKTCGYNRKGIFIAEICELNLKDAFDDDEFVPEKCIRLMELMIIKQGEKDGKIKRKRN